MFGTLINESEFASLRSRFCGRIGGDVIHFDDTTSTMDMARAMVESADDIDRLHGHVLIAERQRSGRGRFKRTWFSKPGEDILASVILRPRQAILGQLTIMASLAAAMTIDALTPAQSEIKWPNDVMVRSKKICGVLGESLVTGNCTAGILGIGLNVNLRSADHKGREYHPSSIRELRCEVQEVERRKVLQCLLGFLNELYDALERGESIMEEWRHKLTTLGKHVTVSIPLGNGSQELFAGLAVDVDERGQLIVKTPHGICRVVSSGEASVTMVSDDG